MLRILQKIKASIPRHLIEYFEQNGNQIKTIGGFLLVLGATNYIPRNWWQSWLLDWELSSQSVISILSILTLLCHSLHCKVKQLENRLKPPKTPYIPKTPEQQAAQTKTQIKEGFRFMTAFFKQEK